MPKFSKTSNERLSTCDYQLQRLFCEVIKHVDCIIIEGYRNEQDQHKYFLAGTSKKDWPNGEHNSLPSRAVDVMPWPLDWKDEKRIHYFIGFVMATAIQMGIKVRSGHDWDCDFDLEDQSFVDSPHWELT